MTIENKNRDAKTLVDKAIPYSEMTEEEIESVIEYKAEILAQSKLYQQKYDFYKNKMGKIIEDNQKSNTQIMNTFESELEKAIKYSQELVNKNE